MLSHKSCQNANDVIFQCLCHFERQTRTSDVCNFRSITQDPAGLKDPLLVLQSRAEGLILNTICQLFEPNRNKKSQNKDINVFVLKIKQTEVNEHNS